jgi:serine/threonine protein phosphatase PrpC
MTKTAGSGATRGGEVFRNEDAFLVEDELGLYAVCDGWGQHPGGEVASFVVIEAIEQCLEADLDLARGQLPAAEQVEDAVRFALDAVNEIGQERADLEGMATTVTLLIVRGRRGLIAHTGDSRAYLLRRGKALQLTSDQEWHDLSEGGAPPRQAPAFTIEVFPVQLSPGDTIVLCTDGAEKELEDSDQITWSSPIRLVARPSGTCSPSRPMRTTRRPTTESETSDARGADPQLRIVSASRRSDRARGARTIPAGGDSLREEGDAYAIGPRVITQEYASRVATQTSTIWSP